MEVEEIKIVDITDSKHKIRRVTKKDVEDLTGSIMKVGIIQPVIVRFNDDGRTYELIAGHRRVKAAQYAKLKMVPAIVREKNDDESQVMQFSENYYRKKMTPFEEARAIQKLKDSGRTYEQIAGDLAMTPQTVARRAQITKLSPSWDKAFKGKDPFNKENDLEEDTRYALHKIPGSHLELISSQTPGVQDAILNVEYLDNVMGETPDLYQLKYTISQYTSQLKSAPFDVKDESLHPAAGSCLSCEKRSSVQPLLFFDDLDENNIENEDRCLDIACFNIKKHANFMSKIKKAEEKHPDLMYASPEYCDKGNLPEELQNKPIIDRYNYSEVSKKAKGSVPAIAVNGKNSGKVIWIKPDKSNSSSSGRPAKGETLSMKQKEQRLADRRNMWILQKVQDQYKTEECVPTKTIGNDWAVEHSRLLRMAAAFGLPAFDWTSFTDSDDKPDDVTDRFSCFEKLNEIHGGNPYQVYDLIWNQLKSKIISYFNYINTAYDATSQIEEIKKTADLVGMDWDQLVADSIEAKPRPKSWGDPDKKKSPKKSTKKDKAKSGK